MDRRVLVGIGVVGVVALAAWAFSPSDAFRRLAWLANRPLLFAVVLIGLSLVRPAFAWPNTLLAVAVGYAYGLAGAPFALFLMDITAWPPYAFGRRAGGDGQIATVAKRFVDGTGDFRSVAATRLLPLPADVISVAAGVGEVKFKPFVLGTAVGELPWAVGGVVAGTTIQSLRTSSLADAIDPRLIAAAAVAALLMFAGPAYRHYRNESAREGSTSPE